MFGLIHISHYRLGILVCVWRWIFRFLLFDVRHEIRDLSDVQLLILQTRRCSSPFDEIPDKSFLCTPLDTKVIIYHLVGNFMLNSIVL